MCWSAAFKGGLAHVNIVASVIFSGMSGIALADAAGPGKLEVDMMVKAGYAPGFSAALSTTSAIIGPIIPPSIPMVIYGVVSDTSIGYLFMGGVIPGLLLALAQSMIVVHDWRATRTFRSSRSRRCAKPCAPRSIACRRSFFPSSCWAVSIRGAVTPTEAAAVAALFALVLGLLLVPHTRPVGLLRGAGQSHRAQRPSSRSRSPGALVMNWIVAAEQIPEALGELDESLRHVARHLHVRGDNPLPDHSARFSTRC